MTDARGTARPRSTPRRHRNDAARRQAGLLVLAASQRVSELVSAGVVLSSGVSRARAGRRSSSTGLSGLKPPMIAEATARAREAAEQFAHHSRSQIGGIRQASQGVFEILPRDQAPGISEESQIVKTARVVSTIDYVLRD